MTNFTSFKNRSIDPSKPVKVYRNLHKTAANGVAVYSVMQDGKVVGYSTTFALVNASFSVSEAGRQRVIREKAKNVHAFVVGTFVDGTDQSTPLRVSYNPYKGPKFTVNGIGADAAPVVKFSPEGVFAA